MTLRLELLPPTSVRFITLVVVTFRDWLLYDTDYNWRVSAEQGGALRAIADIGTHWLDLVQYIVGSKVVAVCADLQTVHETRYPVAGSETFKLAGTDSTEREKRDGVPVTTEDAGHILLKFASGARGCLQVSQVTAGRKNCLRFEIAGAQESLYFNSEQANTLFIGRRTEANQTLIRDPALLQPTAATYASYPGGHNEGFPDTFKQLFRAFYSAIGGATWGHPTFADGHYEVLLCEAILRSHQQQAWEQVG